MPQDAEPEIDMDATSEVNRDSIARTKRLIRPHVRRTPTLEVDGADFQFGDIHLTFKLELLQHAGSFKTRGAFANLLTRDVPNDGVVRAERTLLAETPSPRNRELCESRSFDLGCDLTG